MPKQFSEKERAYIKKRLLEEAAACVSVYGIKHTTVDEIVRRVKIPKGTFYLFYQSKELLLFDVLLDVHAMIDNKVMQAFAAFDPAHADIEQLTDIFFHMYQEAAKIPLLRVLNSEDVELLTRKLPNDVLQAHFSHDNDLLEKVFASLPLSESIDLPAFTTAFETLYLTTLQKETQQLPHFDDSLRVMIRGLVLQLLQ